MMKIKFLKKIFKKLQMNIINIDKILEDKEKEILQVLTSLTMLPLSWMVMADGV